MCKFSALTSMAPQGGRCFFLVPEAVQRNEARGRFWCLVECKGIVSYKPAAKSRV
jgi:hypothetical protein